VAVHVAATTRGNADYDRQASSSRNAYCGGKEKEINAFVHSLISSKHFAVVVVGWLRAVCAAFVVVVVVCGTAMRMI
jgi:hypothetical protein